MTRALAAPDKFKGTATAGAVSGAIATGAARAGWTATELPMSDGGEGLLDVFGGANRHDTVPGPLGALLTAEWRFDAEPADGGVPTAVIEMAQAAGLARVGGRDGNDPLAASTRGVGELVLAALKSGARRLVIGCGGSATTDGGAGALEVLGQPELLAGVEVIVACDVTTSFVEAAARFAPQKGASPAQVAVLEERLRALATSYLSTFGRDVARLPGSGAAGGLAGGLAAIGGRLVSGFDLVASLVGLDAQLEDTDAVITGEGCLDAESFSGKVVGGLWRHCGDHPTLCVAGRTTSAGRRAAARAGLTVVGLTERFGEQPALSRPLELVAIVAAEWLEHLEAGGGAGEVVSAHRP
jgi:glycerate kinase